VGKAIKREKALRDPKGFFKVLYQEGGFEVKS